jgi:hypothetical protein
VRLLSAAAEGYLPDGTGLGEPARGELVIAALELLSVTPRSGATLPGARAWLALVGRPSERDFDPAVAARPAREWIGVFAGAHTEGDAGLPSWSRALASAFRSLERAARAEWLGGRLRAASELDNVIGRVWILAYMSVWSAQTEDTYWGLMASLRENGLDGWIERYREIGLLPPSALANASASLFTRRPDVGGGVAGVDAISAEAFRLWQEADAKATVARRSPRLAEILATAGDCLLLYNQSEVLLAWAIDRLGRDRGPTHAELSTEHRVVEELRVAMLETLRELGDNFVMQPAMISGFRMRRELQAALRDFVATSRDGDGLLYPTDHVRDLLRACVDDVISRVPLYPDIVAALWRELVESSWEPGIAGSLRAPEQLEARVRGAVVDRFQDASVVHAAQRIAARPDSQAEIDELERSIKEMTRAGALGGPGDDAIDRLFMHRRPRRH